MTSSWWLYMQVKRYDGDVEDLGLTFSVEDEFFGQTTQVRGRRGGANTGLPVAMGPQRSVACAVVGARRCAVPGGQQRSSILAPCLRQRCAGGCCLPRAVPTLTLAPCKSCPQHALLPGQADAPVTNENRLLYCHLLVRIWLRLGLRLRLMRNRPCRPTLLRVHASSKEGFMRAAGWCPHWWGSDPDP